MCLCGSTSASIMPVIEIFGMFTKPAALTVRLFANMMGGHMIVLVLTLLIFIFGALGTAVAAGTSVISVVFSVFMLLIDVLVSFIQAYVFLCSPPSSSLWLRRSIMKRKRKRKPSQKPRALKPLRHLQPQNDAA